MTMDDMLKRKAAAMTAFDKIGKTNGSAPPSFTDNRASYVYDAMIADALYKAAEARKDAARKALFDNSLIADNYQPGDYVPYNSDGMAISVKRNNDSQTLDKTKLKNVLMKSHNMSEADVEKLIAASSKPRKGNTIIAVGVMG